MSHLLSKSFVIMYLVIYRVMEYGNRTYIKNMTITLPDNIRYFNISKHWKILNPVYESQKIKELALEQMNLFRESKLIDFREKFPKAEIGPQFQPVEEFQYPKYFDISEWRCFRRGRPPLYDNWVCYRACHWIARINIEVINRAIPDRDWILIQAENHSTIYDGDITVYDTNYKGLGVSIQELVDVINTE